MELCNAIIGDTNVFIHDPKAIDALREDGKNTLFVPWTVILELDRLKTKPDIGYDAAEAIDKIEKLQVDKCPTLKIERNSSVSKRQGPGLDRHHPDHQIVATALRIDNENKKKKPSERFQKVKLVSRDRTVRVLAREMSQSLIVETYHRDESDVAHHYQPISVNVVSEVIDIHGHFTNEDARDRVNENDGIVCYSDYNGKWDKAFAALKKGDKFHVINRDVSAMGVRPYSSNGDDSNWQQAFALGQLLDPTIRLVFLQGGAGTGKTLLAIASAIAQRKLYRQIVISRPMVHLEDEDNIGFLPGNLDEKLLPWVRPIEQALYFLRKEVESVQAKQNDALITKLKDEKKIIFEPLDYIRGTTFHRDFVIIDDAQNLTPHMVKTIITRAGKTRNGFPCKMVFTGDLGQIDRKRRLDARSSGLNYAINRLRNQPMVGATLFKETIRSELAQLAEDRL